MIRFERWAPHSNFYTRLSPSSPLVLEEREGPHLILRRIRDDVAEWLEEHCPGWHEFESRFSGNQGSVRLELPTAENVVEFQIRWG